MGSGRLIFVCWSSTFGGSTSITGITDGIATVNVSGQNKLSTGTGVTKLGQQVLTTLQDAGVKDVQIGAAAGKWTSRFIPLCIENGMLKEERW